MGHSLLDGSTERLVVLVVLILGIPDVCAGAITLQEGTSIHLAERQEGAKILGEADGFIERLSPFDRAARMQTGREVSTEEFLTFVALQARSFSAGERRKLAAVASSIRRKLVASGLTLPLPKTVTIVKTTGREEGQAAYCRGTAVVLPVKMVRIGVRPLTDIVVHELFHILSRTNPELRRELYAIMGFLPCNDVQLPEELRPRRITNPDALGHDYYVEVDWQEEKIRVIPILYASSEKYDVARGGVFFDYLVFRLLAVENRDGEWAPRYEDGKPLLVDAREAPDYQRQLGFNTGYIRHPEETLADNFVLVVNGSKNAPTPSIPAKMKALLSK